MQENRLPEFSWVLDIGNTHTQKDLTKGDKGVHENQGETMKWVDDGHKEKRDHSAI